MSTELIGIINEFGWPTFWAWVGMKFYTDIVKPWIEGIREAKIEQARNNIAIQKFNEEKANWLAMRDSFEIISNKISVLSIEINQSKSDQLSWSSAVVIINAIFKDSAKELIMQINAIIDDNNVEAENRQKRIKDQLINYLYQQKNRIIRALDPFTYQAKRLVEYVQNTDAEHSESFLNEIYAILFLPELNYDQKKTDIQMLVNNHYNKHINEAIEFLKG